MPTAPRLRPRPRLCSECRSGEVKTIAAYRVVYCHPDRPGLRVTAHVCASHAEMLAQDYEVMAEDQILHCHRLEAEALLDEMPPYLREIADGRRVGIPTLRRSDPLERAAGILCPGPVSWRP